MVTDPIADTLTRLRNAAAVGKAQVEFPFSNLKFQIAKLLAKTGFVQEVESQKRKSKRMLVVTLRYEEGVPAISGLKRVSKPGVRIYKGAKDIKQVRGGYGIAIISTSKGLLTDKEARKKRLGGEVLCEIW